MKRLLLPLGCLLLSAALVKGGEAATPDLGKLPPAAKQVIDYQRDIHPILARACLSCHGAEKQRGGLRLDSREAALRGGDTGRVIKPGDAAHSRLLHLVAGLDSDLRMPPKEPRLTAPEMGLLRAWIDQGVPWSKDTITTVTQAPKATHWSFRPIQRQSLPKVMHNSWVRNGMDAFVLARLEAEHLTPSPETDRITLLRRLSLDLLGLPPTPEEVDRFVQDTRPDAYARLVDRLLASPHYGERWARHWLDMARYADSDGFEKDTGRPFAWRYRNWVIDALNGDLPFDRFTLEQLAGDLLPNATTEQKIATGFHRNTLTNREGGVDREQFRVEQVVDRVNTTAKVWLGVTLGCCQCHDHKYDPFSQREYYQFFAFFNSDNEVDLPAPLPEEMDGYQQQKATFDKGKAELKAALAEYRKKQQPAKADPKLMELTKALADHEKTAPKVTLAQTLAFGPSRKTHVLIRGDFLRPGVEVTPGTPTVFTSMKAPKATRLDLARWLVEPTNPLTARVTANWIWQRYFGRGLVATLEDFGTQGEKPSHPELLDWLATEFVRQQWSLKALHRLIVTSATYRQSSKPRPELWARDPLNVLLARQSRLRLEAEILRDTSLAASGLLVRTIGGRSVRPPQPAGISELTYAGSAKWVDSIGPDRYRRGLYTWFQRTSPYPMLLTFDAPDSNVCCVRRERSDTPLQALTLLNDTVFLECAQALGKRILNEKAGGTSERIRYACRLCVARELTAEELTVLSRLFEELLRECQASPDAAAKLAGTMKLTGADTADAAAWVALARAILNLDEFVTRE